MSPEQIQFLLRERGSAKMPEGYPAQLLQQLHQRQRTELLHQSIWRIAVDRGGTFLSEHSLSTPKYALALAALVALGRKKGMAFVGSNTAGNNAFFVRRELLAGPLRELTAAEGYVRRSFREARDADGGLVFPTFEEEAWLVNSLPWVEVER